jgi:hypothetical protein
LGAKSTYIIHLNIVSNQNQKDKPQNERTTLQKLLLAQNASNFNWADRFTAALLNGQKLAVKPIPDVFIS